MTSWRPGDRRADSASMLRVDQAGEYGATRIYAGQLAFLRRNCPEAKLIARMAAQEQGTSTVSIGSSLKGAFVRRHFSRCGTWPDSRSAPRRP
jgi:hypothetical protein